MKFMLKWLKYLGISLIAIFVIAYLLLQMLVLSPPEIGDKTCLDFKVDVIDSLTS